MRFVSAQTVSRKGNVADTRSQSNVVSAEAIKQNRSIAAKADDVCLLAEREQKFCETLLRRHEKNTTATRFGCQTNVREISNESTSRRCQPLENLERLNFKDGLQVG